MTTSSIEKLLVVAPTVPLYDKQSGDFRFFSLLDILAKKYEITYLAKKHGSSNRTENERYVSSLRDKGIIVHVSDYSLKEILNKDQFKAAILEFYYIAEYYLPRIKLLQPSCPVIVDTVDVHYLRLYRKCELNGNQNDRRIAEETKKRELAIYGQADIVLTVTDEDAKILQMENRKMRVKILPNVHNLVPPPRSRNRNELIFVGGFTHDPNVDAVVYFCHEILPLIRSAFPETRFTIVGSNPPEAVKKLNNDWVTVTGYVESTTPYLQNSYISVAPLRYGAGMKGKIGEAMAHGLPVVTTSIGAEGMKLIHGENCMIADSPEGFSDAVVNLMKNEPLYRFIQGNSIVYIEQNYTKGRVGGYLKTILEDSDQIPAKKLSVSDKISFLYHYAKNR
ncbi:MAG: glycosyltransferase [Anaerolineales bacterium]|nr:glycosyltransferase [Anaerolineales bacterium]